MQDQPDQTTLSMRNDSDGLIMSESRDTTAIDNLEDASFDFHGRVGSCPIKALRARVSHSFEVCGPRMEEGFVLPMEY